jgi:rhodanese-related sulfurtransferase
MTIFRSLALALAALLALALPALAQDAPMQIKGATTVNAKEIIDLITKNPDMVILDNRKAEDFAAGHIEGAVRLIDTDVTPESLAKAVKAKDVAVLFYCNGLKCGRAAKAAEKAIELGYSKVFYYALGMEEWNKQGLPVMR